LALARGQPPVVAELLVGERLQQPHPFLQRRP
jgi:hypothetical protein